MSDLLLPGSPAGGRPGPARPGTAVDGSAARSVAALRSWTPHLAGLPAVSVVLLPKCPACLMVVFGALGLGHGVHELAFGLLQIVTLAVLVGALAWRRRGLGPLLLGVAGAMGIAAGQFADFTLIVGLGALLLGAGRPGAPACACQGVQPVPW